ncbi:MULTISPECIES: protein kinase domain-containing protein [unclassified Paenibacillus]|uniref:protein kinase domain-containing protein n=1 Tax=unclassified Paenibacillus TaxID=185978 RepID=UPI0009A87B36|nr:MULTISPECIES: protein kinase [unclassified Paenibacillus]SLJ92140.1 Serine/threonine protein kinase [Paenibacillus sp. RU5A]SOC58658.1 Serine/threonine protein kinase [Paenibacillus sp. RU26A]SOC67710.1 Serine/threonine protein kinase [Paenibacillus sp. RU5M]
MSKNKKRRDQKKDWEDRFDVIRELGMGGNAKVYHVIRKLDKSEFALKHLYNKNEEKKCRFIDEIRVIINNWKSIDGIIPIEEHSEEEFWYTMPIAVPILEYIKASKETLEDIIDGVIQLSATLHKLHSKGISHRDIKPSNIYFYSGRYCFGDFGLVEFPDNPNDFTKSDKGLGAIFTIAPEMKRDPKNADGKKADVFSLAKTMWMLLTEDDRGFDGVYDFLDKSHSLRFMDRFKNDHLVELEELMEKSTDNSPENRPSIDLFMKKLEFWSDVFNDYEKSQASDWNFLNKYLFGNNPPESTVWRNVEKIVNVLNVIGTLPAYNHILFSDGGGLDFSRAEQANEIGCIYLYDSIGFCFVVKPSCLRYEGFNEDNTWNYFLLELDELVPIIFDYASSYEYLVEDYPGSYVSADYSQYGVYDYDSGKPLPDNYKLVSRYIRGKFLIVLKNGPYNAISATYDGRHGDCNNDRFREYISKIIQTVNTLKCRGFDEDHILNSSIFTENPFKITKKIERTTKKENGKNTREFINNNHQKWCFVDYMVSEKTNEENIVFNITFRANSDSYLPLYSREKLYLCKDGYIKSLNEENLTEAYCIYKREEALHLLEQCTDYINNILFKNGFDLLEYEQYFSITLKKFGKPTHLFTKFEIEEAMRISDDRNNNMLVIDENGYAKVIQDISKGILYPVRHESWNAGNIYVGKYSKLSTLDDVYISSLQGWLMYLDSGKKMYMDYVHENKDIDSLIQEIKKYY